MAAPMRHEGHMDMETSNSLDRNVPRPQRQRLRGVQSPSRPGGIGGVKGHPALAGKRNDLAGKPFDMLRAVSSVERPRPVAGELHILAFSPHPDDAELGCGGALLLSSAQGLRVAIADITQGEQATRGGPQEREREKDEAARLLGVKERYSLGLPDTAIGISTSDRLVLVDLIRRMRPRIVLAPYSEDRHPDHEAASRLVREACFYAGVSSLGGGEPFRPDCVYYYMIHTPFIPSFVIDISAVWEAKRAAIGAYGTQFSDDAEGFRPTALSGDAFLRFVEARSIYFGGMIGAAHGEPYFCRGPIRLPGLPGVGGPTTEEDPLERYSCF